MFKRPRIIPILGIIEEDLVKTVNYNKYRYIGDPINAVRIFNGKSVDELVILDIRATLNNSKINFSLLKSIASQAFMPLAYGGGITTLEDAKKIFRIGFEKIIFSTALFINPELVLECVKFAGSSSIVGSIDVKKNANNIYEVFTKSGTEKINIPLVEYIKKVLDLGVGEIILNSINNEGMLCGYDIFLLKSLANIINVPLIINGGAKDIDDLKIGLVSGADSVGASSMFVFFGPSKAVLITFPSEKKLIEKEIYEF